ncbi:MAG: alkaline phosphatase family protein [Microthrixaceae bacterium]
MSDRSAPLLPDYGGACLTGVVPTLLDPSGEVPEWMPQELVGAHQVVLLVLDGLGWDQLEDRLDLAPTLASLPRTRITTVCPTTTSTALTSITTGLAPGSHGVIGYRVAVRRQVLNVLRWSTPRGDARESIVPTEIQPNGAFGSERPPVITRAEFIATGFTEAHLQPVRFEGYRMPSTMVVEIRHALKRGEPFVYAYYDGIDKVAHEYGLGDHYDAELMAVDQMVRAIAAQLPRGAALVVTADHGQVDVGDNTISPARDVMNMVDFQSGEGRFRWLHAKAGATAELAALCAERYGDVAWVVTRDQTIDEGWWGPELIDRAAALLGDVALVAREPVAFLDPADTGPFVLQSRHGSLTSAEMMVPLVVARGH